MGRGTPNLTLGPEFRMVRAMVVGALCVAMSVEAQEPADSLTLTRDQAIAQALSVLPAELAVFGGKMVANIVPAWAHDKGNALAELVNERGNPAAVFLGDDVNDESVFAREDEHWFTVRIGQDYPNSRAQYVMDSTAELPRLLDLMLGAAPHGPNAGALG